MAASLLASGLHDSAAAAFLVLVLLLLLVLAPGGGVYCAILRQRACDVAGAENE